MKLNTTKLQEMNKEEIEKVNGGVVLSLSSRQH